MPTIDFLGSETFEGERFKTMKTGSKIKPMPIWLSLLCFGVPAGIGWMGMYMLLPFLDRAGFSPLWNMMISMSSMFPLLLAAALAAHRLEGNPFSWPELKTRFRIKAIRGKDWFWTTGLVVFFTGGQLALMPTSKWLVSVLPLPLPGALPPVIDPRVVQTAIPVDFLGVPLLGNWGIAVLYLVILFFNIIGEEFWWRGVILPRQELTHRKWAWLLHGILWTLFHVPFWWNLIALLPSTLSLSFVCSRLKNTTPGIIAHFCMNGLGFLAILLGVLGYGG